MENVIEGDTVGILIFGIGLIVIILRAYLGDRQWDRQKAQRTIAQAQAEAQK